MKGFNFLSVGACVAVLLGVQGCETVEAPRRSVAITTDLRTGADKVPDEYRELYEAYERDVEDGLFRSSEIVIVEDGSMKLERFDVEVAIFVVDTSGSMRQYETGPGTVRARVVDSSGARLRHSPWPSSDLGRIRTEREPTGMNDTVLGRLMLLMRASPKLRELMIVDGEGNSISSWSRDEGLFAVDEEQAIPYQELLRVVYAYPYESSSDWMAGLDRALALAGEVSEDLKVEVFVVGDELTGDFWQGYRKLRKRDVAVPVNVLRGHDRMIDGANASYSKTSARFERYSRLIAYLTGGRHLEVVSPPYRQFPETVALRRLARLRPLQAWIVEGESKGLEEWQAALSEVEGIAQPFLVGEEAGARRVDLGRLKIITISENRRTLCYLETASASGDRGTEYVAELEKTGGSWSIVDWKVLWTDQ